MVKSVFFRFTCFFVVLFVPGIQTAFAATPKAPATGKQLTITYCQACHFFKGSNQAGTVAPPLTGIKERYPDRKKLQALIHDPHVSKPHSMMPPFGRNGLLNAKQINQIIDFIYTL